VGPLTRDVAVSFCSSSPLNDTLLAVPPLDFFLSILDIFFLLASLRRASVASIPTEVSYTSLVEVFVVVGIFIKM